MSEEKNLKSVELFGGEKSVFFSDPPLFFGSSGKFDNLTFTNYRNISNPKSITYILLISKTHKNEKVFIFGDHGRSGCFHRECSRAAGQDNQHVRRTSECGQLS